MFIRLERHGRKHMSVSWDVAKQRALIGIPVGAVNLSDELYDAIRRTPQYRSQYKRAVENGYTGPSCGCRHVEGVPTISVEDQALMATCCYYEVDPPTAIIERINEVARQVKLRGLEVVRNGGVRDISDGIRDKRLLKNYHTKRDRGREREDKVYHEEVA